MKCRHPLEYRTDRAIFTISDDCITSARTWTGALQTGSVILTRICEVECDRCTCCGAWLSLGPASDDDERVRIEIRAAELAALPRGAFTTHEANQGYNAYHRGWPVDPPRDSQAGYLAAAIAAREED